jgi:hypothetical protein
MRREPTGQWQQCTRVACKVDSAKRDCSFYTSGKRNSHMMMFNSVDKGSHGWPDSGPFWPKPLQAPVDYLMYCTLQSSDIANITGHE